MVFGKAITPSGVFLLTNFKVCAIIRQSVKIRKKEVKKVHVPKINPISGRTIAEELTIARAIGGRLPFDVYLNLIRRGIIKPKEKKHRKAAQKKISR